MLLREMKQKHSEHLKAIKILDEKEELSDKESEELETRMTECESLTKKIERRSKLDSFSLKTVDDEIPKSEKRSYSLTKAISLLISGKMPKGSYEAEVHQELEKRNKSDGGLLVPSAEIFGSDKQPEKRLVDNQSSLVSDPIKPELYLPSLYEASIMGALGVKKISATGDFNFPKSSKTTAGWITGDGGTDADDSLTEQDQSFTSQSVTPKFLGAITGWSLRQLKQMSGNLSLEGILRENLVMALAEKLDSDMINGSGTAPVPSGILTLLGATTNNTALTLKKTSPIRKWQWSDIVDIKKELRTQYLNNMLAPKFLFSPLVESELSLEQRFSSSDGDSLLESLPSPAVVSSHIADTKVLYGSFATEFMVVTFDSIELSLGMIDSDFKKGNQRLRAIGCFDFVLNRDSGFRQITVVRT